MGTFGAGLYSGDFALDLRSTIRAVSRLPFDGDTLVEILCGSESAASSDPNDEDHTTFWLVVADQFARRGIESDRTRQNSLNIIDSGSDLDMFKRLGMARAGLEQRRKILDALRAKIVTRPTQGKERAVLKKAQPFLMEVGDVLAYPTCYGDSINPYFPSVDRQRQRTPDGVVAWHQDGWSAVAILDRGRAFGFLAWYRPLTLTMARAEKPTTDALRSARWALRQAGTCSRAHFKKMRLERIWTLSLDAAKVGQTFPGTRPGMRQAIDDISIANSLGVGPGTRGSAFAAPGEATSPTRPHPTIDGLDRLLSS